MKNKKTVSQYLKEIKQEEKARKIQKKLIEKQRKEIARKDKVLDYLVDKSKAYTFFIMLTIIITTFSTAFLYYKFGEGNFDIFLSFMVGMFCVGCIICFLIRAIIKKILSKRIIK